MLRSDLYHVQEVVGRRFHIALDDIQMLAVTNNQLDACSDDRG